MTKIVGQHVIQPETDLHLSPDYITTFYNFMGNHPEQANQILELAPGLQTVLDWERHMRISNEIIKHSGETIKSLEQGQYLHTQETLDAIAHKIGLTNAPTLSDQATHGEPLTYDMFKSTYPDLFASMRLIGGVQEQVDKFAKRLGVESVDRIRFESTKASPEVIMHIDVTTLLGQFMEKYPDLSKEALGLDVDISEAAFKKIANNLQWEFSAADLTADLAAASHVITKAITPASGK